MTLTGDNRRHQLRLSVVPYVCRRHATSVWNMDGIILTKENQRTRTKICLVTTSSTAIPTLIGPGIKTRLPPCTICCAQSASRTSFRQSTWSHPVSTSPPMLSTQISFVSDAIQGDSGGKVTILSGASISHCEKESAYEHVSSSEWLPKMKLNLAPDSVVK
jgi:hypothetical protein